MKTKNFLALERQLLKYFPDFFVQGRLMVLSPLERILRGICFESSQFDSAAFYATVFVMPLCVPRAHISLNFGSRVRGRGMGDRWQIDTPNLMDELVRALQMSALPFLRQVETLSDFIKIARSSVQNQRTLESLGYALARIGETEEAISVLDQLLRDTDVNISWQRELCSQVEALKTKLALHPDQVQDHLANCEIETIRKLGLDKYRSRFTGDVLPLT